MIGTCKSLHTPWFPSEILNQRTYTYFYIRLYYKFWYISKWDWHKNTDLCYVESVHLFSKHWLIKSFISCTQTCIFLGGKQGYHILLSFIIFQTLNMTIKYQCFLWLTHACYSNCDMVWVRTDQLLMNYRARTTLVLFLTCWQR